MAILVKEAREMDRKKRIADWLEKMSAGATLIGIFQNNTYATLPGLGFFGFSLYLTKGGKK